jgi:hypothetical protein
MTARLLVLARASNPLHQIRSLHELCSLPAAPAARQSRALVPRRASLADLIDLIAFPRYFAIAAFVSSQQGDGGLASER